MTTPKTTTKTSSKSTTKATTKTKPKTKTKSSAGSKTEKLDLDTFTVSQTELGYILGLATANISPMVQAGVMTKDADGRFNLRDAVSGYCKRMRDRKEGKQSKSDVETETAIWKLQNIKQKNKEWRMTRDRQVATEILNRLAGAMGELREMAKLNPALVEAIDMMTGMIGSVNVDDISVIVEGDDEEDDE